MKGGGETADQIRDRIVAIAAAWREATAGSAYIPLSTGEVRGRFEQLAAEALNALLSDEPAEVVERDGRAIGSELVALNLRKPEVLEQTLACLGAGFDGLAAPERMARLMTGISGGFVGATQAALLRDQEMIRRAANDTLRLAQKELEASRDSLAEINLELSDQIAERTRAEEIQRDYAERLRSLHQIDLAILSAESLSAIADISINYLQHLIPALSIAISLIDIATQSSTILNSTNALYPVGRSLQITMKEALNLLGKGNDIYIPDLKGIPDPSAGVSEIVAAGGRSLLAVPLRYGDELIGGLIIVLDSVRRFSESETAVAREIADSITVAIQNRRLLGAEQDARRRESTLREVAASLTLGLDQTEFLQRILNQLEKVIPSRSSAVFLHENGVLDLAALRGISIISERLNTMLSQRPNMLWTIVDTAQPIIINDTANSPEWQLVEGLKYIRAWMGIPLIEKGKCIGVITIDRDEPNAFSERDRDLAATFANQAAIAIANVRLFAKQREYAEQLERRDRERERELAVLYGITVTAVSHASLDTLLERSLDLVVDAFNGAAAVVYLVEGEESGLQPAALVWRQPQIAAAISGMVANDPVLLRPLTTNQSVTLTASDLPTHWPDDRPCVFTLLPLSASGQNLGVLGLVCDAPARLTGEAFALLSTIVDQIAVAVENIRLRQITRQSAIIEERERLAREIHDAVTQSIYSIGLFAEAARGAAEVGDMTKVQQRTQSILTMTDLALRELRLLLFELRTESLARLGLVGALDERLLLVERQAGIQADLYAHTSSSLPIPIEEAFFRIALEALNNSLRHARANRVEIALVAEDGQLEMTIADDGIGFDQVAADRKGGMGLDGMRKRIKKVNGALTVVSQIGQGTRISVRAPLQQ